MKKITFLSTLLLLITVPSFGFTLNQTSSLEGFSSKPVKYYLNISNCPADIESDIEAAVDLWNSVPTSGLKVEYAGRTTSAVSGFKSYSFAEEAVIGCSIDFNNDITGGCDAACLGGVLGVSNLTRSGNRISKSFVLLNENNGVGGEYSTKSTTTRQIVLAHEMGHSLGLGHTGESSALMHFSVSLKVNLNLHQDDIDGITYLYPRDEFGGDFMGCGIVSAAAKKMGLFNPPKPPGPKSPLFIGLVLMLFLLPLLFAGVLRRRLLTTNLKLRVKV